MEYGILTSCEQEVTADVEGVKPETVPPPEVGTLKLPLDRKAAVGSLTLGIGLKFKVKTVFFIGQK